MTGTHPAQPSVTRAPRPERPSAVLVCHTRLETHHLDEVRAAAEDGARVVAWEHPPIAQERFPGPNIGGWLAERGVAAESLVSILGTDVSDEIEDRVIDAVRAVGRAPLQNGGTLLTRLVHRSSLGLWWWGELYLYHETPLRLFLRDIEALDALREHLSLESVLLVGPTRDMPRLCTIRGLDCKVVGPELPAPWHPARGLRASLMDLVKLWGSTLKALLTRHATRPVPRSPLFLTHASMWRADPQTGQLQEGYLGPLMSELDRRGTRWRAVAVGPTTPYRRRTRGKALHEMVRRHGGAPPRAEPVRTYLGPRIAARITRGHLICLGWWGQLRWARRPQATFEHAGVCIDAHVCRALGETLLLQLPWAIRAYEEMRAVLARERPGAVVLYAESSGRGRAAVAAARSVGIPTLAVQHGILYPRYFSYEHARVDVDGPCDGRLTSPLPTRTAVFGELAQQLLTERGRYPPESVVITGSPHFDAVARRSHEVDREEVKRRLGVPSSAPLLVLATRMSALGTTFTHLVAAVEAEPQAHLVVKPHPAESPDPYEAVVRDLRASAVRVLPPNEPLADLLATCDALVTVDSLASSEALVVGHPVLVLNLPNHLHALVESGAALGVWNRAEIAPQLARLLHDPATLETLREARERYIHRFAAGADGRSVERILAQLDDLLSDA